MRVNSSSGGLARNLVPWRGDGFALAERAAAGGAQTVALFEGETATLALSRLHRQPPRMRGAGDMLKVIEDFFLANPE